MIIGHCPDYLLARQCFDFAICTDSKKGNAVLSRFFKGQHTNRELSVVNWKYKGMDMNTERMVKLFHLTLQSCKLTLAVAGSVVLVTQRGESLIVTDWKSVALASIQAKPVIFELTTTWKGSRFVWIPDPCGFFVSCQVVIVTWTSAALKTD